MATTREIDDQFAALVADLVLDPTDLPEWLTSSEPHEFDLAGHPGVDRAAELSGLNVRVQFISSPTARHANHGAALAVIDHAATEISAMLAGRNIPRRRLRALLNLLEAML